jgi:hypothetical protein
MGMPSSVAIGINVFLSSVRKIKSFEYTPYFHLRKDATFLLASGVKFPSYSTDPNKYWKNNQYIF